MIWVMIPAGITGQGRRPSSSALLEAGDIIIDGGNSNYRDDIRPGHGAQGEPGIHYLDVGTSGGVWGLDRGYCLMIGGDEKPYQHCDPLFASIAPGVGDIERTPGRDGEPAPAEQGYLHCGPAGAGHFVKMVHNGIEYGMMAAYAEGLNVLHKANAGKTEKTHSAEETPLDQPQYYQYDIDLAEVTEVWRRGSVIASWLLDLTAGALLGDAEPRQVRPAGCRTPARAAGRSRPPSTRACPPPVLAASLFARFSSRGEAVYADKLLSAMRKAFGGHNELPTGE